MSSITSPWSIFGAPQVTSLMAALNFRRDPGTAYQRPSQLSAMETRAADELGKTPAIAKYIAIASRVQVQEQTLAAARQELADSEQHFSAQIETPIGHHDFAGEDLATLRANVETQEAILGRLKTARDAAKAEATREVEAANQKLRATQVEFLNPLIESGEKEIYDALFPLLEKVGAIHAAKRSVMYATPLTLDSVAPPTAEQPTAEPELAAAE